MRELLAAILLLLSGASLSASQFDAALATARETEAKVKAASSVHTPSYDNFQAVKGEIESLPPFLDRLARDLANVHIGPADEVRSVGLDLKVKVHTASGYNVMQLSAFIEACRGISGQLRRLEALLPGLIAELRKAEPLAVKTVAAVTGWTPPSPTPGTVNPGTPQLQPTVGLLDFPTPTPGMAATPPPPPPPPPSPPYSGPDFGVIPGGPVAPPPPQPTPVLGPGPFATPTPLPPLKVPVSLAITADGRKVYVANASAGTVSVLDTGLRRVVKEIPVGAQPSDLALTGGDSMLVVANYGSSTATLIDARTDAVLATLKTAEQPVDLALSNSGQKAYVACQGGDKVTVLDLKKLLAGKSIKVGSRPARVVLPQNSRYAYVSNSGEDTVSVIDLDSEEVIATVEE